MRLFVEDKQRHSPARGWGGHRRLPEEKRYTRETKEVKRTGMALIMKAPTALTAQRPDSAIQKNIALAIIFKQSIK